MPTACFLNHTIVNFLCLLDFFFSIFRKFQDFILLISHCHNHNHIYMLLWLLFLLAAVAPYGGSSQVGVPHYYSPMSSWKLSQNLSKWYSAYDLCVLQDNSTRPVDDVVNSCEKQAIERGDVMKPIRCRVGNSWPTKSGFCASEDVPYTERLFFRMVPPGDNMDDPTSQPLRQLFEQLAAERSSLLLVGDSVMQQFFAGIACELERENIWKDTSYFTNTDEVRYVQLSPDSYAVPIRFLPVYHFVNSRFDRVANASMFNLRKGVEDFLRTNDGIVIMVNMGLHYVSNPIPHFSRLDYQSQMTNALQYLHSLGSLPNKKVRTYWRETSAQHFPTSNGYWPGQRYSSTMKLACVPINDTSPGADWRNEDVSAIIRANKFNIDIIPFYDVSLPLWSMHVNGHHRDCTHFCWSPMLYMTIFRDLAKSVLKSVKSETVK